MAITRSVVVIANRTASMAFQTMCDFCKAVNTAMVTAAATFPTPPITLATFNTDIVNFQLAINSWGALGNRGSHADYISLLGALQIVTTDCTSLAGYVQAVARASAPGSYPDQVAVVLLAGMRVKNDSNRLMLWGPVNNFRQLIQQNLQGTGIISLRWNKPNVVPGANSKPPTYNLYSSADNITFAFQSSTSATFAAIVVGTGNTMYYKVAPVSAAGEGGMSPSIQGWGL